jgi:hypothetical protein
MNEHKSADRKCRTDFFVNIMSWIISQRNWISILCWITVQNEKINKNILFEILSIGAILKNINWGYVQISGQIGFWSLWKCQKPKDMLIYQ